MSKRPRLDYAAPARPPQSDQPYQTASELALICAVGALASGLMGRDGTSGWVFYGFVTIGFVSAAMAIAFARYRRARIRAIFVLVLLYVILPGVLTAFAKWVALRR